MDTFNLVDPELRALLDALPDAPFTLDTLAEVRARKSPFPPPGGAPVQVERHSAPGPAGAPDVQLRMYRPSETVAPSPCIYHIHGGGYVSGAAANFEWIYRPLAGELACVIVSVDYRLAPETVFPGALEDCYAGLQWLFAQADALGLDPQRIGVMGESAGGGLAAALALLARDRAGPRLAFQHLKYPMLDDRTCVQSDAHPFAGQFVWTREKNHFGWSCLLGGEPGGAGVSPYAAAARAPDLSGLPPTFISTGALDLLMEENLEYARRLARAGVPVELHVYPGAFHGFDFSPDAAVAVRARRDSVDALKRALYKPNGADERR